MNKVDETDLQEETLLRVHELSLGDGDTKVGRIKLVHALQESTKPGAQLALAIARRVQVPARM